MNTEAKWLQLNADELNQDVQECLNGVQISHGTSPYDIPGRVRRIETGEPSQTAIQFGYLTRPSETYVPVTLERGVTLVTGGRSGRIYAILITEDAESDPKRSLLTYVPIIEHGLETLSDKAPLESKRQHYRIARDVLHLCRSELFSQIE